MKFKKVISSVLVSVLVLMSTGATVPVFAKSFGFDFLKLKEIVKIKDFKTDDNSKKEVYEFDFKKKLEDIKGFRKKLKKIKEFKFPFFKPDVKPFGDTPPVLETPVDEPVIEEDTDFPPTIVDPFEEDLFEEPAPVETNSNYPWHYDITTTMFWLGEEASADNGWISNESTAYESPADSVNDWYVAVPLSDITVKNGQTVNKDWVSDLPWYDTKDSEGYDYYSYLKNRWVEIHFGDEVAYGQVQDSGPHGEDLYDYVILGGPFDNPLSQNNAGLDVSPAINDYLGMDGRDDTNWRFVEEDEVPDGPWNKHVETQQCVWGQWGDVQ